MGDSTKKTDESILNRIPVRVVYKTHAVDVDPKIIKEQKDIPTIIELDEVREGPVQVKGKPWLFNSGGTSVDTHTTTLWNLDFNFDLDLAKNIAFTLSKDPQAHNRLYIPSLYWREIKYAIQIGDLNSFMFWARREPRLLKMSFDENAPTRFCLAYDTRIGIGYNPRNHADSRFKGNIKYKTFIENLLSGNIVPSYIPVGMEIKHARNDVYFNAVDQAFGKWLETYNTNWNQFLVGKNELTNLRDKEGAIESLIEILYGRHNNRKDLVGVIHDFLTDVEKKLVNEWLENQHNHVINMFCGWFYYVYYDLVIPEITPTDEYYDPANLEFKLKDLILHLYEDKGTENQARKTDIRKLLINTALNDCIDTKLAEHLSHFIDTCDFLYGKLNKDLKRELLGSTTKFISESRYDAEINEPKLLELMKSEDFMPLQMTCEMSLQRPIEKQVKYISSQCTNLSATVKAALSQKEKSCLEELEKEQVSLALEEMDKLQFADYDWFNKLYDDLKNNALIQAKFVMIIAQYIDAELMREPNSLLISTLIDQAIEIRTQKALACYENRNYLDNELSNYLQKIRKMKWPGYKAKIEARLIENLENKSFYCACIKTTPNDDKTVLPQMQFISTHGLGTDLANALRKKSVEQRRIFIRKFIKQNSKTFVNPSFVKFIELQSSDTNRLINLINQNDFDPLLVLEANNGNDNLLFLSELFSSLESNVREALIKVEAQAKEKYRQKQKQLVIDQILSKNNIDLDWFSGLSEDFKNDLEIQKEFVNLLANQFDPYKDLPSHKDPVCNTMISSAATQRTQNDFANDKYREYTFAELQAHINNIANIRWPHYKKCAESNLAANLQKQNSCRCVEEIGIDTQTQMPTIQSLSHGSTNEDLINIINSRIEEQSLKIRQKHIMERAGTLYRTIDNIIAQRKRHNGWMWRNFDEKEKLLKSLKLKFEKTTFNSLAEVNSTISDWLQTQAPNSNQTNAELLNEKRRLSWIPRCTGKTATLKSIANLDAMSTNGTAATKRRWFCR